MNAFDEASRKVLSEFLQTAVVIDDAAYDRAKEDTPPATVKTPGRGAVTKASEAAEAPANSQSAHSLDTRALVSSFASKGLACAVLDPPKKGSITDDLGRVAERCDIVIIDWQMFNDNGGRTCELIKKLCTSSAGERLRLLCVYSGEPDLEAISEALQKKVADLKPVETNTLLLRKEHAIVTILKKGSSPDPNHPDASVTEEQLANKLIEQFSGFTKGLLSNAVLASLAGIRRNTYRIVRKFDTELDPAYISHRIMSVPIDNVENEILSIIASELEAVVHQVDANYYINADAVNSFIESRAGKCIKYDIWDSNDTDGPDLLAQLIEHGIDDKREGISVKFKSLCKKFIETRFVRRSNLTKSLGDKDKCKDNDKQFAILSTMLTRYEDYTPKLTLGTIVHDEQSYLLCVMPRCDCARIPSSGRNFLFLKLVKAPSEVDLIVKDNNIMTEIGVRRHPYDTVIYNLTPSNPNKPVFAKNEDGGSWKFVTKQSDGTEKSLRWVTDIKPQVAQAFVAEYIAQVGRVGVAKSQWLHRLGIKDKHEDSQAEDENHAKD